MATKDGKKTGGRKKGTPNKPTQALLDKAKELGVDPFEILLLFAKGDWESLGYKQSKKIVTVTKYGDEIFDDVISPELRVTAAKEAAQYLHPKRKAIEVEASKESDAALGVIVIPSNGREKDRN